MYSDLCGYWSKAPEHEIEARFDNIASGMKIFTGATWGIAASSKHVILTDEAHSSGFLVGDAFDNYPTHSYQLLNQGKPLAAQQLRAAPPWGRWSSANVLEDGQRLMLTRDPQGLGTLYFAAVHTGYVFANRVELIAAMLGTVPEWNWSVLAPWILPVTPDETETGFLGVKQVPPGSRIEFTANHEDITTYWTEAGATEKRSAKPDLEQLRSTFINCVNAWLKDESTGWVELSGGLDSSALIWAVRKTGRQAAAINYFDSSPAGDEREHAKRICDYTGAKLHFINVDDLEPISLSSPGSTLPCFPYGAALWPERAQARQSLMNDQSSTLLSGIGSDHIFAASSPNAAVLHDRLLQHGWRAWYQEWLATSRHFGSPLLPLFVNTFRHEKRRRIGNLPTFISKELRGANPPTWLNADSRQHFPARLSAKALAKFPAGKLHQLLDTNAAREQILELHRNFTGYNTPFFSKPLIELALRTSVADLVTSRDDRIPFRAMLRGHVPDETITRRTKGDTTRMVLNYISQRFSELRELALDGHAVSAGIVDRTGVELDMKRARAGQTDNPLALLRLFAVEIWCHQWAEHRTTLLRS